ncbi:protein-L-isoaspartate O-methyltransferase family protein [Streptomyces sp. cmx-18-6]|uniref:protein-L-isoaspartate O-methyltransferase family protein n=1 Tax=Streptomyces sp. cmx-18-6 TaxID=2790930 RepID=UPI00397EB2C1
MGSDRVVSVEVDPALAEQAAKNNAAVGLSPRIVEGDGCQGWPEGAPYQRIIATYAVDEIPSAWVEQAPPGRIVSPRGAAPSSHTRSRFSTCTRVAPRENSPATPPSCALAPGGRSAAAGQWRHPR